MKICSVLGTFLGTGGKRVSKVIKFFPSDGVCVSLVEMQRWTKVKEAKYFLCRIDAFLIYFIEV